MEKEPSRETVPMAPLRWPLWLALAAAMASTAIPLASAAEQGTEPELYEQSKETEAVGRPVGGEVKAGLSPNAREMITTAVVRILGAAMQAWMASTNEPNTINGVTYTEVFSFGKRVFNQSFYLNFNGQNGFNAGLAPMQIRVPVIAYPVGPVLLQVDGGVRFQADLMGSLVPVIGIPIELSSLGAQVTAKADAAGFIEGYAKFLVVRAGVGGQVDLVDAKTEINARFTFDGAAPYARVSAMVEFLKGRFYAFADYFSIRKFGWKRLLDYNLYSWNGYCFATQSLMCPY
jgi:hypothetical protein